MERDITRRDFLAVAPVALAAPLLDRVRSRLPAAPSAARRGGLVTDPSHRGEHPEPRPGIDASQVIPSEELEPYGERVREVYDMVREMPHVADGIGCFCGCATRPGYRSLLTCYYADGMAMGCQICQGEARLVHRRWKEGQALDQIRRAIDARYG